MIYVFSVNLAATKTCKNVGSKRVVIGSFHAIRHTLLLWIFRWHPPARDKANNVKIDSCRKFVVSGCIWPKKSKPSHGEKIPNFWSHGLRTSVGAMQLSERTHLLVPFSKTYCNGDQWKSKWSTSEQNWRTYPKVFWSGWSFQNGNHRGRFKGGGNSFFFIFTPGWNDPFWRAYWSRMPAANWSSMLDTSPNAYGTCRRRGILGIPPKNAPGDMELRKPGKMKLPIL